MSLEAILMDNAYIFILIMIRYLGLFLVAPILGSGVIPVRIKVGLVFLLTILTYPLVGFGSNLPFPEHSALILLEVLRELLIGFILGFIALLTFVAIQMAGRFVDLMMGFAIVNVMDPIYGDSLPMMGQFKNILAVFLFLGMNGHHVLLQVLRYSFELIPLGGAQLSSRGLEFIFRASAELFLLALQIALPVLGVLFIVDMILGFMARTLPQMNIFVVGIPLKIVVGFLVLLLALHFMLYFFADLFNEMFRDLYRVIHLLS